MSFVKKAVKKVFKGVKKIVKSKIFKYVAIAAAIFFTAGIAAGGFAAFSAAAGSAGFFTAVGQTIATGAAAMAGGVGLSGASSWLAGHGGIVAASAGLSGATAVGVAGATAAGLIPITEAVVTGVAVPAGGTIGQALALGATKTAGSSGIGAVLGKVLDPKTLGGQMVVSGIVSGLQNVAAAKNKQKHANSYVAGGTARGGSSTPPDALHYTFGDQPSQPQGIEPVAPITGGTEQQPGGLVPPPQQQAQETPAPPLGEQPVHPSIQRIRDRLAMRDAPNTSLLSFAGNNNPPTVYDNIPTRPEAQYQPQPYAPDPRFLQDKATQLYGLVGA